MRVGTARDCKKADFKRFIKNKVSTWMEYVPWGGGLLISALMFDFKGHNVSSPSLQ